MSLRRVASHGVVTAYATLLLAVSSVPAIAAPTTILFVGNSYTYGEPAGAAGPTAKAFMPDSVTDLNGTNIGGVPALFKAFTKEAGLDYQVSLETVGGKGLDYHYNDKLQTIDKPFDKVVLQGYSTLDQNKPGNPDLTIKYSGLLAQAFHDKNPNVNVYLDATWSRADLTYKTASPWNGKSIYQMALDVRAGYDKADQASRFINGVIPVGEAWNRAISTGLADSNPYNGIDQGKFNLWAPDNYHASVQGYYLEALTMFGSITGLDPRSLGASDLVAHELGISINEATALQGVAAAQLVSSVPEPGTALMYGAGAGLLLILPRRKKPAAMA
ncbi:PEP-CTERM sorting domain-containing protein [Duganella sp. FT134W]|uniref:PEP-CTERM sorting domain-containing protein n=1 Tax=Duganella margarita TaxID=2692170 RepID=A0A7X4H073_9BURK|nr:PEP-CTERM sorting domain-containing protein [Duganella margarita]MYM72286.1 PEP-CTERM sorting domain-containing protein [Duganella margarita]